MSLELYSARQRRCYRVRLLSTVRAERQTLDEKIINAMQAREIEEDVRDGGLLSTVVARNQENRHLLLKSTVSLVEHHIWR